MTESREKYYNTVAAMRREIDKLSEKVEEALIEIEIINEWLESLKQKQCLDGLVPKTVGTLADLWVKVGKIQREFYPADDLSIPERLTEVERRADEVDSRVSDLEVPAPPSVAVWRWCTECDGKGKDLDPDEEGARCGFCSGRGQVRVPQPALWEKLEEANADVERLKRQVILGDEWYRVARRYAEKLDEMGPKLEESRRTIDKILQAVNDSDLSREEMIKEVDKALI